MNKNKNNTSPNNYLVALLNNEPCEEEKLQSFETAICRQYCDAICYPNGLIKQMLKTKPYLSVSDFNLTNEYRLRLFPQESFNSAELLTVPGKTLYNLYLKDLKADKIDIVIVNDNSSGARSGLAMMYADKMGVRMESAADGLVLKQYPGNKVLICGSPYAIFRTLVLGDRLRTYVQLICTDD